MARRKVFVLVGAAVITVVSTGFNSPTGHLCKASVAAQKGVESEHLFVDAAEQHPPLSATENLRALVAGCPPDRVVAWLDLDDWLAHPLALSRVEKEHNEGAWATWGSYAELDGTRGEASQPTLDHAYRKSPWIFSHLKTFRAGLLQRIQDDDLKLDGEWLTRSVDVAVMLPILEQAGRTRARFIEDILVIYNFTSSFEANAKHRSEVDEERNIAERIRQKRRYARLAEL
jgi:hypothetical protein